MGKPTLEEFRQLILDEPVLTAYQRLFENDKNPLVYVGNIIKGFVAYTNTDLTEGRGSTIPRFICRSYSTAKRLAQKIGVQGSDGDIKELQLFAVNGQWYGPVTLHEATAEDLKNDQEYRAYKEAVSKALAAGLTGDDLKILRRG